MSNNSKSERLYLVEEFPTLAKTELGRTLKMFEVGIRGRGYDREFLEELEQQTKNPMYQPDFSRVPKRKPVSVPKLVAWMRTLVRPGN